ncbi:MAG: radical SAM protein [Thermodesulfobacteriota bacterium]
MADRPASSKNSSLNISELFYSIQGESSFAGYPCFFIRLAGCNLRCSYCDTAYAYKETGEKYSLGKLMELTEKYPAALILITGGEPLLQEKVYPLMELLLEAGRKVMLETNGSISVREVPPAVVKVMDLKCPDSGMSEQMNFSNLDFLTPADELKFVISSRLDYDWALDIVRSRYHPSSPETDLNDLPSILFSPETTSLPPFRLAGWILEDHLQVRLQLQLHKVLWPRESRGV